MVILCFQLIKYSSVQWICSRQSPEEESENVFFVLSSLNCFSSLLDVRISSTLLAPTEATHWEPIRLIGKLYLRAAIVIDPNPIPPLHKVIGLWQGCRAKCAQGPRGHTEDTNPFLLGATAAQGDHSLHTWLDSLEALEECCYCWEEVGRGWGGSGSRSSGV